MLEQASTSPARQSPSVLDASANTRSLRSSSLQQSHSGTSDSSVEVGRIDTNSSSALRIAPNNAMPSEAEQKNTEPSIAPASFKSSSLRAATKSSSLQAASTQPNKTSTSSLASAVAYKKSSLGAAVLEKPSRRPESYSSTATGSKSSFSAAVSKQFLLRVTCANSALTPVFSKQSAPEAKAQTTPKEKFKSLETPPIVAPPAKEEIHPQLHATKQIAPSLPANTSIQYTKSSLAAASSKTRPKYTDQRSTIIDQVMQPSRSVIGAYSLAASASSAVNNTEDMGQGEVEQKNIHLFTSSKKPVSKASLESNSSLVEASSKQPVTQVQGSNQTSLLLTKARDESQKETQAQKQTYSSLLAAASKKTLVGGAWSHNNQNTRQSSSLPTKTSNKHVSSLVAATEKGNGKSSGNRISVNQPPHSLRQQSKSSEPTSYAAKTNNTIAHNQGQVSSYAAALNKKSPSQAQRQQHKPPIHANDQASISSHQHEPSLSYNRIKELKSIPIVSKKRSQANPKPKKRWGDESNSDSD